jgi:hypothetical protein
LRTGVIRNGEKREGRNDKFKPGSAHAITRAKSDTV